MLNFGGVNRLNINQSFALAQPIFVGNVNKETEALGHCRGFAGFSVRAKVSRKAAHQRGQLDQNRQVHHQFLAIKINQQTNYK